jgi:phosphocarrier protein
MRLELQLKSTHGLHATLAAKIVQLSSDYNADVSIQYDNVRVDAKSLLGLLSLAIPQGENLTIIAEGEEAEKALKVLQKIIETE